MNSSEQQLLDELRKKFPDFKCTLQDLRNPSEEFVTDFYTYWLSEFEVDIKNIPQMQFSQTSVVSAYIDAYSSSTPKLNLMRSIQAFDVVPDFGILDIISPTPKRIQSIIRSFLEFFEWCDARVACMMELKTDKNIKERKQKLADMNNEEQELRETINSVLISIGEIQELKKELEENIFQLQQKAAEQRLEKDIYKTQRDEADEKLKEKEAILQKIIKEDSQITNKIKECSHQIVDSPTSLLVDLDGLRIKKEEMAKLSEQKRDMVEEKMLAQENLKKVLSSVEDGGYQLDELLKIIDHQRKLLKIVSDIDKDTSDCQEKLEELKSVLSTVVNKKSSRQEALQSLTLKCESVQAQLTQSVEAAIREFNEHKTVKSKMLMGLKEDAFLQEKIDTVMKNIETIGKLFQQEYEKILHLDKENMERIETHIKTRNANLKKAVEERYRISKQQRRHYE